MQKFGLDALLDKSNRYSQLNDLQREFLKDGATALGAAGRLLVKSLERLKRDKEKLSSADLELLHKEIAEGFYNLMLQREFTGFVDSNIEWMLCVYDVPKECFSYMGVRSSGD